MNQHLEEYKGKNILITDGAGCIGSNLTKALSNANAEKIIVLDDFSASYKWNVPRILMLCLYKEAFWTTKY